MARRAVVSTYHRTPPKKGRVYTQKPKPQEVKEVNTIRRNIADKEDETYRYTQFEIHEIYG